MPDNPQTPKAAWFSLSDHRLVAISGRDAVAFAHAQTMNDVAALGDGEWHWNGWLTPKGRVIALFALLRLDAESLWLLLPDVDADALAAQLRRFVFRSKLTIAVRDDLRVAGRLQASDLASGNHWVGDFSTGNSTESGAVSPSRTIELDLSGDLGAEHLGRSLRIGPSLEAPEDPIRLEHWRRADLEHGWPRLDASQAEQWTPQQLSLERLRAYSVKKGCYPGQEIVARTHFLGQAKRGLALVRSTTPLAAGMGLPLREQTVGAVVSTCSDLGLAVIPLELDNESSAHESAPWTFLPLRNGLAR